MTPSVPHGALARLAHARKVVEVVSFNWDTLLESAFKQRFGFEINAQGPILTKPHGDCRTPEAIGSSRMKMELFQTRCSGD
jgi:hypothetical protein